MFPLYRTEFAPKHFGMKNVSDRPSVSTWYFGAFFIPDRFRFEVLRNDSQVETGKRNDLNTPKPRSEVF